MSVLQRRRWERYRKELEVFVSRGEGRESIRCRTLDVCEGGLGLICPEALEVGSTYAFEVREISAVPLAGTVRWCTASTVHKANHVGVELTGITARQVEELANAIARWRAADLGSGDG